MTTLTKVTGEKLTLVFAPDGSVSSAKLCGKNVVSDLRWIREHDCALSLLPFGFAEQWPEWMLKLVKGPLIEALKKQGLTLVMFMPINESAYDLLLTRADNTEIHPIVCYRAVYSRRERCIKEVYLTAGSKKNDRNTAEDLYESLCKIRTEE